MTYLNRSIGSYGETLAIKYLLKKNYKILFRNFFSNQGEIDIIALDTCSNCLCFIEVKSRYTEDFGYPRESVDFRKVNRIKNVANYYIYKNNLFDINGRFDVIEIFFSLEKSFKINHLENAF